MTLRTILAATVLTFATASTAVAKELPKAGDAVQLKVEKPVKGELLKARKGLKVKPVRKAIK